MVLFRHTLTKVSSGGAIDAVALNGFAGEDFGPSDCRAVVRPNVPKLAIDATAGCVGCEVADGLCLVSLPGAASLWVADVSQTPQLRPLASFRAVSRGVLLADGQRVFLGGGCDDGVLCDIKIQRDATKKRKTEEGSTANSPKALHHCNSRRRRCVALGSLTDATFGARTAPVAFQPQREGDARKAAREARSSRS